MVSRVSTFSLSGIEAIDIDVQCQLASGAVHFTVVGLADKTVAESRDRIRAAFATMGLSMPPKKIIVNLSPADINKEGSHYDLPIILALLCEMKMIPEEALKDFYCMGEVALDGSLVSINGILPSAIAANSKNKGIICPKGNALEAKWASDEMEVIGANNIIDLINHFSGKQLIPNIEVLEGREEKVNYPDFRDIKGQENARRASEIAAAGGHNLLMSGPPGSGKSMIAARIPSIMPDLNIEEILETSVVHSVAGNIRSGKLITNRPYRSPHHNCSMPAMIGGGVKVKPGEISLSHNGVLFLDELPEFPRQVLDSLRQPLETREVSVSRVNSHVTYPAKFQLIAAMNPCKCGYLAEPSKACSRAPKCGHEYQMKLSGPLLDRFDIHIDVPAQNPLEAYEKGDSESSESIRKRVIKAREIQKNRLKDTKFSSNSEIEGASIMELCKTDEEAAQLLKTGVEKLSLSMRGHAKVLKVARTIADLAEADIIGKSHMAESLSYRMVEYVR